MSIAGRQSSTGAQKLIGRLCASSLALALVVLAFLTVYVLRYSKAQQTGVWHDDAEYLVLAESFATGQSYRLINYPDAPRETVWPPGYPLLFLTIPWKITGGDLETLRLVNLLPAVAALLLSYALLAPNIGKTLGVAATLLFALNPQFVGLATVNMSDIAYSACSLAFLYAFASWTQKSYWHLLLGTVILLASSVAVRYQGIALLCGSLAFLVINKQMRPLLAFAFASVIALLPLSVFLVANPTSDTSSSLALQIASRPLQTQLDNIALSLRTYAAAVPLTMVPLLGERVEQALAHVGLQWIVSFANGVLLLLTLLGMAINWRKLPLISIVLCSYLALLLIVTRHPQGLPILFDEPRYLVPILPFLYAALLSGVRAFLLRMRRVQLERSSLLSTVLVLLLILSFRNMQQARNSFSITDLSAGGAWARENAANDAVFMTPDPVSRYLYLRRATVAYPNVVDVHTLFGELEQWSVDYLLIAPPLTIAGIANTDLRLGDQFEQQLIPILQSQPDCFQLAFLEQPNNTTIYRVVADCTRGSTSFE